MSTPDATSASGPEVDPASEREVTARSDALERLIRPARRQVISRRPLFRRAASGPDPQHRPDVDDAGPPLRPIPPWVTGVGAALIAVLALGGWLLLRRAPDAVSTLPRASSDAAAGPASTASAPSSSSDTGSSGSSAGSSGSAGSSVPGGGPVTVHVAGAVLRPGVVSLAGGSRAVDAVAAAGGLVADADADRVNLAAKLTDGERLVVPVVGQPAPAEVQPQVSGASGGAATGAPAGPIDLNSATAEQLDALPGVGPATAAAIVSHRDAHGPFRAVDDLLDVRGIGEAKLDALRDLVSVGS